MRPARKRLKFLLLLISSGVLFPGWSLAQESVSPLPPLIAEGDRHWELRAEGSQGSRAATGEIDLAISDYRKALEADPPSLAARWRLMRALYFKGEYATGDRKEKQKIFDEGRKVGEEVLQRIRQQATARSGKSMERAGPLELAPLLKESSDAIGCFFWSAANWGGWALAYGKLAAARQGVAGKIRDLAMAVSRMAPDYEEGGGFRILGRLHHQTPSIPFITGWASKKEAVRFLRQASERGPRNFLNRLFLAEALWDQDRNSRDEAIRIVEALAADPPRPEHLVEERKAVEQAKALLKESKKE